jgi:transposase
VTEIARGHGIATSLVFTWRRRARRASAASAGPRLVLVQVTVASGGVRSIEAAATMPVRERRGLIEIDLGDGKRVCVDENVDAEALGRVFDVLIPIPSGVRVRIATGTRTCAAACRASL